MAARRPGAGRRRHRRGVSAAPSRGAGQAQCPPGPQYRQAPTLTRSVTPPIGWPPASRRRHDGRSCLGRHRPAVCSFGGICSRLASVTEASLAHRVVHRRRNADLDRDVVARARTAALIGNRQDMIGWYHQDRSLERRESASKALIVKAYRPGSMVEDIICIMRKVIRVARFLSGKLREMLRPGCVLARLPHLAIKAREQIVSAVETNSLEHCVAVLTRIATTSNLGIGAAGCGLTEGVTTRARSAPSSNGTTVSFDLGSRLGIPTGINIRPSRVSL